MQSVSTSPLSGLQRTQIAEEKLAANIDLAASVAEELSKFGTTDFTVVEKLSAEFLKNAQEAKQALTDVIAEQELSSGAVYQGRPYAARLKAEAAEANLEEAKQKLAALQRRQQLEGRAPQSSDTAQATASTNGPPGPSSSAAATTTTVSSGA